MAFSFKNFGRYLGQAVKAYQSDHHSCLQLGHNLFFSALTASCFCGAGHYFFFGRWPLLVYSAPDGCLFIRRRTAACFFGAGRNLFSASAGHYLFLSMLGRRLFFQRWPLPVFPARCAACFFSAGRYLFCRRWATTCFSSVGSYLFFRRRRKSKLSRNARFCCIPSTDGPIWVLTTACFFGVG